MLTNVSSEKKVVHSNCRGCHGGCGVLVTVKNGVIDKIEGDPDFPTNHGTLCSKGLAFKQLVYHPDRLKYPMKRIGKRGEGKWERVTWDEALDTIAQKVYNYKAQFGMEFIVLAQGTSREFESFLSRFAYLLGTPNVMGAGYMCYLSRVVTALSVCGKLPIVDCEGDPKCVIVWGNNVVWNNADEYTGENLMRVLMLDVNGFQVFDLGVDVPAQISVKKISEVQPDVVALSGFLTVAFDSMKRTVEAITAAGMRDTVKIMVGGGSVDEHARAYAGADAFGTDAMSAVTLAKKWTGVN